MSTDKHRNLARMAIILETILVREEQNSSDPGRIMVDHEGGMSSNRDPTIVRMKDLGLIRFHKDSPPKKFYGAFRRFFNGSIHGHAPRRFMYITDRGREFYRNEVPERLKGRSTMVAWCIKYHKTTAYRRAWSKIPENSWWL